MSRVRTMLSAGFLTVGLLAASGVLMGCQTGPSSSVRNTVALTRPASELGDIAIAAPTSGGKLGTALREELYRGLIARGFSVLDLAFVDEGGQGTTRLLTSVSVGPQVTGVRTALYDGSTKMIYEQTVAAPVGTMGAGALAELLLRDLPVH